MCMDRKDSLHTDMMVRTFIQIFLKQWIGKSECPFFAHGRKLTQSRGISPSLHHTLQPSLSTPKHDRPVPIPEVRDTGLLQSKTRPVVGNAVVPQWSYFGIVLCGDIPGSLLEREAEGFLGLPYWLLEMACCDVSTLWIMSHCWNSGR